jgi:hypothetical protein
VIPFTPKPTEANVELPYFPNLKIACGHFRTGRTDAEEHKALPTVLRPDWIRNRPLHRARHR